MGDDGNPTNAILNTHTLATSATPPTTPLAVVLMPPTSSHPLLAPYGRSQPQFIDLCILLGCDYCEKIPGIGPHKAIALIRKHKTIEEILKNIDVKKYPGIYKCR